MTVITGRDYLAAERRARSLWWVFLVTGIAWVVVAFAVLTVDPNTPATVGYLAGFVLLIGGVNELVDVAFADGWRWLHALLGVLILIVGVMALMSPFQTFGILALLVGWYLMFKGIADVIVSIADRDRLALWGLLLATGIFQIALGAWAVGHPGRSAWLLVLWIGLAALARGITEIIFAFRLRGLRPAVA